MVGVLHVQHAVSNGLFPIACSTVDDRAIARYIEICIAEAKLLSKGPTSLRQIKERLLIDGYKPVLAFSSFNQVPYILNKRCYRYERYSKLADRMIKAANTT